MTTLLTKVIADFSTTTTAKWSVGATSGTLTSGLDADGIQLPTGTYGFTIDRKNSSKEYFTATLTGANLTSIKSVTRGTGIGTSGLVREHRKGAEVIISDYVAIKRMMDVFDGSTAFDADVPLTYDGAPTFTDGNSLVTKDYADAIAIAGGADASTTTKGIVEEATQAEVLARTAAGGTSGRLFVNPTTLTTVQTYDYAADAGANDTYAITVTPAPVAYVTGQRFSFKANTVNTGACTLNVNTLGAKSLKMNKDIDPVNGYIKAGAIVEVEYDGTNMQILSVSGKPSVSQTGEELYAVDTVGTDSYAITLTPAPVAYVSGMTIRFKAGTANTGAATLAVNGLTAKDVVKNYNSALVTGDILQNQIVEVVYDSVGDNFQMVSPTSPTTAFTNGTDTKDTSDASTTQNIAHSLGKIPKKVKITFLFGSTTGNFGAVMTYNGTTSSVVGSHVTNNAAQDMDSGGNIKLYGTASGDQNTYQTGVITWDATNIIITWTKTSTPTGSWRIMWEAEG